MWLDLGSFRGKMACLPSPKKDAQICAKEMLALIKRAVRIEV